jgi:hypothetical protein
MLSTCLIIDKILAGRRSISEPKICQTHLPGQGRQYGVDHLNRHAQDEGRPGKEGQGGARGEQTNKRDTVEFALQPSEPGSSRRPSLRPLINRAPIGLLLGHRGRVLWSGLAQTRPRDILWGGCCFETVIDSVD